ncbi:YadA-like family protein [Pseudoxanthomonas sp. UC29_72]
MGTGNVVSGANSGAFGDPTTISGSGSYSLGNNNTIANNNAFVVGSGVTTTQDNSVVLGNASADRAAVAVTSGTINGTTYTYAGPGSAANGVVSVGASGKERQVINVAAGQVSGTSTDAINGSQLYATNQAVNQIGTTVNNITNGGGIKYFHANSTLADSTATGTNSVAVGPTAVASTADGVALGHGAVATNAGDVALGAGSVTASSNPTPGGTIAGTSYTYAGTAPASVVSVGATGSERQITNVAAGRVNASSTDAVNGSQLYATNQATGVVNNRVTTLGGNVATVLGGNATYNTTTGGLTMTNVGGTGQNNVNDAISTVAATAGKGWNVTTAAAGTGTVSGTTAANVAPGATQTVTAGDNIAITQNGTDYTIATNPDLVSTSITTGNSRLDTNGLTITGGPSVLASGIDAGGQRITNVAAGTQQTDAVNLSQLQQATTHYYSVNSSTATRAAGSGTNYDNLGATGGLSVAAGANASAGQIGATAIGDSANAAGVSSVALGQEAAAIGTGDITIGRGSGTGSLSSNYGNIAMGLFTGTDVAGRDNVAIGDNAGRTVTGSNNVALGIGGSNVSGDQNVAIGAAGTNVTGSYNVGLGSLAGSGVTGSNNVALGQNAGRNISASDAVSLGHNASANNSNDVALGARSVTAAAVGTASTTIQGTTYAFAGTNPGSTVSMGALGSERTVTNVAAGRISDTSTDAVNGSQLYAANQAIDVVGDRVTTLGGNVATVLGGNATYDQTTGGLTMTNVGGTGQNNVNDAISTVAATAGKGWNVTTAATGTGTVSGTSVANVAPGATQTVTAGDNIAITQNGTDLTIATNPDLVATSLTAGNSKLDTNGLVITGGPSVLASGIDAGGLKVTNVADGTVAAGSKDAVNGGQLFSATSGITSQGLNFTGDDASAGAVHRDLGQTLAINGGASTVGTYSGDNLKTVTDPTNGAISLQMADAPKFGAVTVNDGGSGKITGVTAATLSAASTDAVNGSQLYATNTYINNAFGGGADVATGTAPTYTVGGNTYNNVGDAFTAVNNGSVGVVQRTTTADVATMTAAGGTAANPGNAQRLTNLADGINGNDAVNLSQLTNATSSVTTAGLNFAGDSGMAAHRDLGQTLNLKGGATGTLTDNNIGVVSDGADTLTVKLAKDIDLGANGSLTTGNTVVNNTGLTIAGGPSVTGAGINAGGSAITNVGAGVNGTDAANMDQLNAVSATASKGWNVTTAATGTGTVSGTSVANVAPGATQTITAGDNIAITQNGTDYAIALNPDLVATSITTGSSRLDTNGLSLTGGPGGTVVLGNAGLDNGGNRIVNVAAGTAATDAVNVSQLTSAIAGATTHYYSVSDGGNQGGNYSGDGATGSNALAAGVGTNASAAGATAVGSGSSASGTGATAIGRNASASAQGSVALGDGASDGGRGAESYTGKYSGASNASVGTVSVGDAATGATRTISNVADGRLATDAVNLRQLDGAVQTANAYTDSQVQQVNQQVAQNNADIKNVQEGRDGFFQVNNTGAQAKPSVTGANASAGGAGAVASGANSLAVGTQAAATADNAVALGSGSVASRANTVSVGQAGSERQITNVAAGVQATDAVNVSQLQASQQGSVQYASNADGSVNYSQVALGNGQAPTTVSNVAAGVNGTDAVNVNQLNQGFGNAIRYTDAVAGQVQRDANGGIAAAVATANLPQSYIPGRGMTSVGLGSYQGQSAIAVGVSAITDNGRWVIKFSGTADTRGQTGVGAGVGYQW